MDKDQDLLRYPIGRFQLRAPLKDEIADLISSLGALPGKIRSAVSNLNDEQLDTPYRPGGWTLRQVVHHLPDSHMNAYIRFKLALTEDNPTIRIYHEDRWANCWDARYGDVIDSIDLLDSLHRRWVAFLKSLNHEDFSRTYFHPEHKKDFLLGEVLAMYVWHGEHHLSHINQTLKAKGW